MLNKQRPYLKNINLIGELFNNDVFHRGGEERLEKSDFWLVEVQSKTEFEGQRGSGLVKWWY